MRPAQADFKALTVVAQCLVGVFEFAVRLADDGGESYFFKTVFKLMLKTLILITPAMYRECCFMQRPMNWYYRTTITKWAAMQFQLKRLIWIVIFQKSGDSCMI